MTSTTINAEAIAKFLQDNPEFFEKYPETFANLKVPHPHQSKAISLGERQILTLRSRMRDLEWQLSGLVRHATGNEKISQLLIDWCASLLAEDNIQQLPEHIEQGIARLFELPNLTLKVWDLPRLQEHHTCRQDVSAELKQEVAQMQQPWCGKPDNQVAITTLSDTPASAAIIPITIGTPPIPVGVLVLGSPDETRFTPDMGTDFLKTIARLSGAALNRLYQPEAPTTA